nr:sulfur carrier protein ThiS [uncultured Anaerostipes sp.]
MIINGEKQTLIEPVSLDVFLKREGYQKNRIAVERNGEIVPKSEYEKVIVTDSDLLEIVTFVGGG